MPSSTDLVFQWDYRPAIAAEGGDLLQVAVSLRQGHHWSVAEDGMAAGGEVPASGFGMLVHVGGRPTLRLRGLCNRHAERHRARRNEKTKQQG
jgi:hypothetical protein